MFGGGNDTEPNIKNISEKLDCLIGGGIQSDTLSVLKYSECKRLLKNGIPMENWIGNSNDQSMPIFHTLPQG